LEESGPRDRVGSVVTVLTSAIDAHLRQAKRT